MNALTRFGDLRSIAEVYSVPRIAAQAMTVGMRPGFSIDIGTINLKTGASWNLERGVPVRKDVEKGGEAILVVRQPAVQRVF